MTDMERPTGLDQSALTSAALRRATLHRSPLGDTALDEPALRQAAVGEPALGDPAVCDPAVCDPALREPGLGRSALMPEDPLSELYLTLLAPTPPLRPVRRAILAVDIENSTTRTNPVKARLRQAMYDLIQGAFGAAGIGRQQHDPLVDRGDGVLALIRQTDDVPTTSLLDTVIPALSRSLNLHNEHRPDRALRLRVVLHAGEVLHDGRGCFGQALDLAFRLLDSPETRAKLRQAWPAPLALVVSEDIYSAFVAQGYPGIAEHRYEPRVQVLVADRRHTGWTHVPDY